MVIGGKLDKSALLSFPSLEDGNHTIKSLRDSKYNCIAYAANHLDKWWWPSPQVPDGYWPQGVPNSETIEAFVLAYKSIGYIKCNDGSSQAENEKIAIYAILGVVKHAARQLPSGIWVSKLGSSVDIEHELDALNGPNYGSPVQFMVRNFAIGALHGYS